VEEEKIIRAEEKIRNLWEELLNQEILWIGIIIVADHRGLPVDIKPLILSDWPKSESYPVEVYHA